MLFRMFAPRGLKKARRAMHAVSLLTPKPVKKAKMAAVNAAHPAGAVKRAAKRSAVRNLRNTGSSSARPRAVPAPHPKTPTARGGSGPSSWTFRADPKLAWTFLTLCSHIASGQDRAVALEALDQYGTGRSIAECIALLRACPDAAEECEAAAICTESYAGAYDDLANRLRDGGTAPAAEVSAMEMAIQERLDAVEAEARTFSEAVLRMKLAWLRLQAEYVHEHPNALDTNQLLMLDEQMRILLAEAEAR